MMEDMVVCSEIFNGCGHIAPKKELNEEEGLLICPNCGSKDKMLVITRRNLIESVNQGEQEKISAVLDRRRPILIYSENWS